MRNTAHLQHSAEELRCIHISSTHENRPSGLPEFHNLIYHGRILGLLGLVDKVIIVLPDHRPVGRDDDNVELVDGPELAGLGLRSTGHAGKLVIHTEIVLESDGSKGLCGSLDGNILLGLDSLVETVAPAASLHDTASLLIHNLDLSVDNDIVHVLLEH